MQQRLTQSLLRETTARHPSRYSCIQVVHVRNPASFDWEFARYKCPIEGAGCIKVSSWPRRIKTAWCLLKSHVWDTVHTYMSNMIEAQNRGVVEREEVTNHAGTEVRVAIKRSGRERRVTPKRHLEEARQSSMVGITECSTLK